MEEVGATEVRYVRCLKPNTVRALCVWWDGYICMYVPSFT